MDPPTSPSDHSSGPQKGLPIQIKAAASPSRQTFKLKMSSKKEEDQQLAKHLGLLKKTPAQYEFNEITTTSLFTMPVLKHAKSISNGTVPEPFPQYGLIAGLADVLEKQESGGSVKKEDPRIFFNVAAPSSTFICGSQGSGKSHTLSCLLENCLASSDAGKLPRPATGIVFHYDTFISDDGGSPCEAAFLSSNPNIKVRVLCSPTNFGAIERTYRRLNIPVEPLQLRGSDLNTKRMLDLMAVNTDEFIPLYVHTIYRILREMRILQGKTGSKFDYNDFKKKLIESGLSPAQLGPLRQRLDTLESFMPQMESGLGKGKQPVAIGTDWTSKPGWLTIVDLSCPCVTPENACSLFNVCLSLFVEQDITGARVIALDEAHKYMNASTEATTLTDTLLSIIRLQRHLGARIIISTQEPTISTALLDLCTVTIAHRFTSPDWLQSLKGHIAAVANNIPGEGAGSDDPEKSSYGQSGDATSIFAEIVRLRVGEALLFSPSAILELGTSSGKAVMEPKRLGTRFVRIRVRNRLTSDGGKSVMAS